MVKSCLVLLSTVLGSQAPRADAFADARDFVWQGGETFMSRITQDTRDLPQVDDIMSAYGPAFNLLYVTSDGNGRVSGYVVLYNVVAWRILLAENVNNAGAPIALISNPLEPSAWSARFAELYDMDCACLANPELDYASTKRRLDRIMPLHFERGGKAETSRLVDAAFARYCREGDVLTEAIKDKIVRDLTERTAAKILGLAHERTLSEEEIAAIVQGAREPSA